MEAKQSKGGQKWARVWIVGLLVISVCGVILPGRLMPPPDGKLRQQMGTRADAKIAPSSAKKGQQTVRDDAHNPVVQRKEHNDEIGAERGSERIGGLEIPDGKLRQKVGTRADAKIAPSSARKGQHAVRNDAHNPVVQRKEHNNKIGAERESKRIGGLEIPQSDAKGTTQQQDVRNYSAIPGGHDGGNEADRERKRQAVLEIHRSGGFEDKASTSGNWTPIAVSPELQADIDTALSAKGRDDLFADSCWSDPKPTCKEELEAGQLAQLKQCFSGKWVVLVGDSNMRKAFEAVVKAFKSAHVPLHCHSEVEDNSFCMAAGDTDYRSREQWDGATRTRLSFRFAPFVDAIPGHKYKRMYDFVMNPDQLTGGTNHSKVFARVVPFATSATPDVILLNTGLWELIGISASPQQEAKWRLHWLPKLGLRLEFLLTILQETVAGAALLWVTGAHINESKLTDNTHRTYYAHDHMNQLTALNAKIALRYGVPTFNAVAATKLEGAMEGDGYHIKWSGLSGRIARMLLAKACAVMKDKQQRQPTPRS